MIRARRVIWRQAGLTPLAACQPGPYQSSAISCWLVCHHPGSSTSREILPVCQRGPAKCPAEPSRAQAVLRRRSPSSPHTAIQCASAGVSWRDTTLGCEWTTSAGGVVEVLLSLACRSVTAALPDKPLLFAVVAGPLHVRSGGVHAGLFRASQASTPGRPLLLRCASVLASHHLSHPPPFRRAQPLVACRTAGSRPPGRLLRPSPGTPTHGSGPPTLLACQASSSQCDATLSNGIGVGGPSTTS